MHELATFKAKYAVSNRMLTHFLDVDLATALDWVENDTAPEEVVLLVTKVSTLIERFIHENEALPREGPYIQALKHEVERAAHEVFGRQTEIAMLKVTVNNIMTMGFLGRLKFLVTSNVS